jgi:glucokinase
VRDILLLGDIGGTNARFALLSPEGLGPVETLAVADYAGADDAIAAFLRGCRPSARVHAAILGIAAPVNGGRCQITNSAWIIDSSSLCRRFGLAFVDLHNDFEAVACALPHLQKTDLRPIGGGQARTDAPMVALGPGTGFGVAALLPDAGGVRPVASEGGHATLAAGNAREDAILDCLRRRFGHVSVERVVSGPGLENLFQAIAALDGSHVPPHTAGEITEAGLAGTCPVSRAALEQFCAFLGSVAGNFALTFKARGGIFIAGGIAPRIFDFLAASAFRERFEAKGRYRAYLETIPSSVIVRADAAFLGLKAIAETAMRLRPGAGSHGHIVGRSTI